MNINRSNELYNSYSVVQNFDKNKEKKRAPDFGPNVQRKLSLGKNSSGDDAKSMFSVDMGQQSPLNDNKARYLTEAEILQDYWPFWTDLTQYGWERDDAFKAKKSSLKRTCR